MVKNSITFELDSEVKSILEKRAKKEFLSLRELIQDILRRSAISWTGGGEKPEKLDDKFIGYFSRQNRGRKR